MTRRLLSIVAPVVVLACSVETSVGPPAATDASAAKGVDDVAARAKVYCHGTSCYAAAFDFADFQSDPVFGAPYTVLTAHFQNLQGSYPAGGSNTPLELGVFRFVFLGDDEPRGNFVDALTPLSLAAIGAVRLGANRFWSNDGYADPGPPNFDTFYASPGHEIVGCSVWPGNPPDWFFFQTCPSQGLDGWVKVEFVLRRYDEWAPAKPPVRFRDFRFTFGKTFTEGCTIGGNEPGTCTETPYRQAMR